MPYYSPILPLVFVNGAPRALIAKTKSNQSQGREATPLRVLYSCLMSRYRWEGRCLSLIFIINTSTFKPCHNICQLGSAPDNVDGLKVMFYRTKFRLIHSPHLMVRATSERFLPTGGTFRAILANESHWLQPMLVLSVHWWPAPTCVGSV